MKVYFLHPPVPIHFAYQEMIFNPPKTLKFVNAKAFKKKYESRSQSEKTFLAKIKSLIGYLPMPTFAPVEDNKADVIYASQMIPLGNQPYVLDLEMPTSLARFHQRVFDNPIFLFLLKKSLASPRCLAITTWSTNARKGLLKVAPELAEKTHVLNKTVETRRVKERKREDLLLFTGTDFVRKGGIETLEAFRELKKKHKNLRLLMLTRLPEKYEELAKQPGVEVHSFLSREKLLKEILPSAKIFVLPTLQDTYGLVFVEALAAGLPVITLDDYATKEIVGKGGVVLPGYKNKWFTKDGLTNLKHSSSFGHFKKPTAKERKKIVATIVKSANELLTNKKKWTEKSKHARERVKNDLSKKKLDKKLTKLLQGL